jgi:hypothetical protein
VVAETPRFVASWLCAWLQALCTQVVDIFQCSQSVLRNQMQDCTLAACCTAAVLQRQCAAPCDVGVYACVCSCSVFGHCAQECKSWWVHMHVNCASRPCCLINSYIQTTKVIEAVADLLCYDDM